MGGENQSTLQKDPVGDKGKTESVLPADAEILSMAEQVKSKSKKKDKKKEKGKPPQQQEVRQHVSKGECHWHVDAEGLKAAIPVADWYVMVRQLKKMETVEYVDVANKTHIVFEPSVVDGSLQLSVRVEKVKVSDRFVQVLNLAGK